MWGNNTGKSVGLIPMRRTLGPLFLIAVTCPFVLLIIHTIRNLDGSFPLLAQHLMEDPLATVKASFIAPTTESTACLVIFAAFELILMKLVPGRMHIGPVTPMGNRPVYTANGLQCYFVTLFAYLVASYGFNLFRPEIVYDAYPAMISSLNVVAFALCIVLYLKGVIAPSTSDSGSSGNPVFDFYWGTELFPEILGWNVKLFTNCRFGMMGWAIAIISFAAKQDSQVGLSTSMLVSVFLQLVYISKFFWWEMGYMASIDIMHDRAGYYICWGCLVWLPGLYTSSSHYLVQHPIDLGLPVTLALMAIGYACIWINLDADRQRQNFRATNGNCLIWGSKPSKIVAKYKTSSGEERTSLLLTSGWWSVSRHFHYLPELGVALCWSVPVPANNCFMSFAYFAFLTILLLDRAYRDDARCGCKYGKYWEAYKAVVPYRLIPYVL